MHPKPDEEEPIQILSDRSSARNSINVANDDSNENTANQVTTANLIQLDGYDMT